MNDDSATITPEQQELERLRQRVAELEQQLDETLHRAEVLQEREAYLLLALSGSGDGVWDWNIETGQMYFSPGCMEMMGYHPDEVKGYISWWERLVHPEDMVKLSQRLKEHFDDQSKKYEIQYRLLTRSGEWRWVLTSGSIVARDDEGRPLRMSGILADVNRDLSQEMQTFRDTLTGLFNRRYFQDALEGQIRRSVEQETPVGVILISVDPYRFFFKVYGKDACQSLLQRISEFLQSHIRGGDIACRYGEEEFALILPGASPENTQKRARKIGEEVKRLWVPHTGERREIITLSLGVAGFPDHGSVVGEVETAAYRAMEQAKRDGFDRVALATRPNKAA